MCVTTAAAPLDGRPRELVGFGFLGTVPKLVGMCGPLVAILGEGSSASAQATDGFYAVRARLEVGGGDDGRATTTCRARPRIH